MKTLKPMALSALTGPFERQGRVHLCVIVGVMTTFDGEAVEHEQNLWKILAKAPGFGGSLDELRPKVKSEVLMLGDVYAPPNRRVPARSARLQVGNWSKEVWVVGDRYWKNGVPTEPVPFDKMAVTWDRAFGGEEYVPNPVGLGITPVKNESGNSVVPLPNIEWPKKLVTAPGDRPPPAGFGPIDPAWTRRIQKLGTYDKKWFETRYPDFPDDFDPTYFNVAPDDQWFDKPFVGGEKIVVEHMHPTLERIEGTVPRFTARCFVSREGQELADLSMRCDTLWLLPNVERMVLVYRAFTEVADDEASDVTDMLFALERTDQPMPRSHYSRIREKRLDRERGALWALRDKDLMPEGLRIARAVDEVSLEEMLETEDLAQKKMDLRAQVELDRARAMFAENGIDPDTVLPKTAPVRAAKPADDDLGDIVETVDKEAQDALADAEKKREENFAAMRKACEEHGLDFDKLLAEAKGNEGGPPKWSAKAELERLNEMATLSANTGVELPEVARLLDPELEEKLYRTENELKATYRKYVHMLPRVPETTAEERLRIRAEVFVLLDERASLTDRDFTNGDLSGIDFSGRDLSRSFFEGADLSGCKFVDAILDDAVLARANLTNAVMDKAKLRRCNLGEANLVGASLTGGVDATESVWSRANLTKANLRGILLDKADVTEAQFDGADLSQMTAREITVFKSDFRGIKLRGACIEKSNLLELDLSGVDLSGVSLPGTVLLDVKADHANFDHAQLESLRVVGVDCGCSLVGATFRKADMRNAFLRGAKLEGADFSDATIDGADFSKCDLRNAKFDYARARDARFIKANLAGASLEATDLMNSLLGGMKVQGTKFERANLFRADAVGAVGDDKTSFRGANVKFVRQVPKRNNG